jgi:hypothetical protein
MSLGLAVMVHHGPAAHWDPSKHVQTCPYSLLDTIWSLEAFMGASTYKPVRPSWHKCNLGVPFDWHIHEGKVVDHGHADHGRRQGLILHFVHPPNPRICLSLSRGRCPLGYD